MAKQMNLLPAGQVITTALHTEMQQSYLEYAMSVIVGRALPDVRDGLKPVHRRVLYAMHELGLTPDRPYRKCARVVGDVLGKYHPHGDQAVYDALVRMVQDFSSRYPLLAGHGNFGSVDDDPPAAMRYTETRLAAIGNEALLSEIGEATVDFIGNFDNSQQEPTVLPAQLPILLLNGSSGIAVGMATNIPPHNLEEIVEGLIALIDRPDLSDEKLFELIPGPDFPTGGEIVDRSGIWDAYTTGRGSIPVRGIAQVEEVQVGRGRHRRTAIVVTELPFQVNKAAWIEKVADLVTQGRIEGISDIRDESDRDGIRVVIELKREASPQKILNFLYRQTALQSNFGVILLALSDGQPRQMTLRELLQQFLSFREETLTRRYRHELEQAQNRLHILEGMLAALENLDDVITILREAPDGSSARAQFQEEFGFSERQSDAILAMPLRRLTGMERQNLQTEFNELSVRVRELEKLLGDRRELLKALKKDLRSLKKKYGDPRRTRILAGSPAPIGEESEETTADGSSRKRRESAQTAQNALPLDLPEEEEAEEVVLEVTQRGYVRRLTPRAHQRRQRNGDRPTGLLEEGDDFVVQTYWAYTDQTLAIFTRSGKVYPAVIGDIPAATGRAARGTPLVSLLPPSAQNDPNAVVASLVQPEDEEDLDLLLMTQQGRIKRLSVDELADLTGRGLTLMKLKEDDQLLYVSLAAVGEQVVVATSGGRAIRFELNDDQLPISSRASQGVQAIRLRKQEQLVGWAIASEEDGFLMVSAEAYGKRMQVTALRAGSPGDLGIQVFQFSNKADSLVSIAAAFPETEGVLLTSNNRMARLALDSVALGKRDDRGERLLPLQPDERTISLTLLNPAVLETEEG